MSTSPAHFNFARYLNIRSAYGASFSADGESVAFLTNITGVPQVWQVPAAGGWPDQLTFYDERVSMAQYAPARGDLVFAMDAGGNERSQLYLLSGNGETVERLTHHDEAIYTFGCWDHTGRRFAYGANERDARYFDVFVHDLAERAAAGVFTGDGTFYPRSFSPDGRSLLIEEVHGPMDSDLHLLDLTVPNAPLRHLTPHHGMARYGGSFGAGNVAFAGDGRGIFVLTDHDREFMSLAYLDLNDLSLRILDDSTGDAESLALLPDGRRLAYALNVDGYSELRIADLGADGVPSVDGLRYLPQPQLPRGVIVNMLDRGLAWSPDGRTLAISYMAADDNPDVWSCDVETGVCRRITHSTRAGIPRDMFVQPELVHFPTFDGRQIPGFLYVPQATDGARPPAIMLVHGGPESQSRPGFDPTVQYFVQRGYAVLLPNVRGSTGYGRTYTHLDDVDKRMDAVADLEAAVRWLRSSGAVDPERLAVMGGSYGGFMVLAAVTTYPDLWAAGVDIVGIADFATFLRNTGPWRRVHRIAEYGDPDRDAELFRRISPIHHVDRITAPLLVIHGRNDPRVPLGEAEQIATALEARNRPVELLIFDDEGHGVVKLPNRITAYTAIADFLDRHLGRVPVEAT